MNRATPTEEQLDQERADHEAGHYVIACVTNMGHRLSYISIEPGIPTEKNRRPGGVVAAGYDEDVTPDQWGVFLMAGMAAQMVGICKRHGWKFGDPLAEDAEARVIEGGHGLAGDFLQFAERLGAEVEGQPYLDRAIALVNEHWMHIESLSEDIKEWRTLFHNEASMVLMAARDNLLPMKAALAVYRRHRRKSESGREYEIFKKDYPGAEWYESFQQFIQREGCKDHEDFGQWYEDKMSEEPGE